MTVLLRISSEWLQFESPYGRLLLSTWVESYTHAHTCRRRTSNTQNASSHFQTYYVVLRALYICTHTFASIWFTGDVVYRSIENGYVYIYRHLAHTFGSFQRRTPSDYLIRVAGVNVCVRDSLYAHEFVVLCICRIDATATPYKYYAYIHAHTRTHTDGNRKSDALFSTTAKQTIYFTATSHQPLYSFRDDESTG